MLRSDLVIGPTMIHPICLCKKVKRSCLTRFMLMKPKPKREVRKSRDKEITRNKKVCKQPGRKVTGCQAKITDNHGQSKMKRNVGANVANSNGSTMKQSTPITFKENTIHKERKIMNLQVQIRVQRKLMCRRTIYQSHSQLRHLRCWMTPVRKFANVNIQCSSMTNQLLYEDSNLPDESTTEENLLTNEESKERRNGESTNCETFHDVQELSNKLEIAEEMSQNQNEDITNSQFHHDVQEFSDELGRNEEINTPAINPETLNSEYVHDVQQEFSSNFEENGMVGDILSEDWLNEFCGKACGGDNVEENADNLQKELKTIVDKQMCNLASELSVSTLTENSVTSEPCDLLETCESIEMLPNETENVDSNNTCFESITSEFRHSTHVGNIRKELPTSHVSPCEMSEEINVKGAPENESHQQNTTHMKASANQPSGNKFFKSRNFLTRKYLNINTNCQSDKAHHFNESSTSDNLQLPKLAEKLKLPTGTRFKIVRMGENTTASEKS